MRRLQSNAAGWAASHKDGHASLPTTERIVDGIRIDFFCLLDPFFPVVWQIGILRTNGGAWRLHFDISFLVGLGTCSLVLRTYSEGPHRSRRQKQTTDVRNHDRSRKEEKQNRCCLSTDTDLKDNSDKTGSFVSSARVDKSLHGRRPGTSISLAAYSYQSRLAEKVDLTDDGDVPPPRQTRNFSGVSATESAFCASASANKPNFASLFEDRAASCPASPAAGNRRVLSGYVRRLLLGVRSFYHPRSWLGKAPSFRVGLASACCRKSQTGSLDGKHQNTCLSTGVPTMEGSTWRITQLWEGTLRNPTPSKDKLEADGSLH